MVGWLIENTLITAGIALVLFIACRHLRLKPAVCHLLWAIVLVRLVAPRGKDAAGKEWQDQEWLEQSRFVFSCVDDSGKLVDAEVTEQMFNCSATTGPAPAVSDDAAAKRD